MTATSVAIFLSVQVFFTLGDLLSIWWESGRPNWSEFRRDHLLPTVAIVFFWILFFAVQVGGLSLIPGLDTLVPTLQSLLGINPALAARELAISEQYYVWNLLVISFFTVSFWDYVGHRFVFHHRFFWFLHEYHHLPRRVFNGMPGISVRPFVFASTSLTYVATFATMALPLSAADDAVAWGFISLLPVLILTLTLILSLNHSHLCRRFPWIHSVLKITTIATPQEHIYHHSVNHEGNFGNFSTLWDRVFGTYISPKPDVRETLSLGLTYDQDFFGTLTLGKIKVPQAWRKKFGLARFCPSGAVK
ncbi:MAG: sterol desaturase family protein [Bdellovibrionia bacterium]